MQQLDPDDGSLHPAKVLVLNQREQATVRAMLRLCADLTRSGVSQWPRSSDGGASCAG